MNRNLTKLIYLGLLVTFGLVLHLVEQTLPNPFPLPGARLGLANIITLITLELFGLRDALFVGILRVFLGNLLAGTILGFPFYLSFAGAIFSLLAMSLAMLFKRRGILSLVGVSIVGAAFHNLAQLLTASVLLDQIGILFLYMPYLLIFAIPTGLFTGLITTMITNVIYTNMPHITRA